ncbi:hypothetical protein P9112_007399 [Eukaryota sp. TZLM1-RC]
MICVPFELGESHFSDVSALHWIPDASQLVVAVSHDVHLLSLPAKDSTKCCSTSDTVLFISSQANNSFTCSLSNGSSHTYNLFNSSSDTSLPSQSLSQQFHQALTLPNGTSIFLSSNKTFSIRPDLVLHLKLHTKSTALIASFGDLLLSSSSNGTVRCWDPSCLTSSRPSPLFSFRSKEIWKLGRTARISSMVAFPCMEENEHGLIGVIGVSFGSSLCVFGVDQSFSTKSLINIPCIKPISTILISNHFYLNSFLIWVCFDSDCEIFLLNPNKPFELLEFFSFKTKNTIKQLYFSPSSSFIAAIEGSSNTLSIYKYCFSLPFTRLNMPFLDEIGKRPQSLVIDGQSTIILNGNLVTFGLDRSSKISTQSLSFLKEKDNLIGIKEYLINSTDKHFVFAFIYSNQTQSVAVFSQPGYELISEVTGSQAVLINNNFFHLFKDSFIYCHNISNSPSVLWEMNITSLIGSNFDNLELLSSNSHLSSYFLTVSGNLFTFYQLNYDEENSRVSHCSFNCESKLFIDTDNVCLFWNGLNFCCLVLDCSLVVFDCRSESIKLINQIDLPGQIEYVFFSNHLLLCQADFCLYRIDLVSDRYSFVQHLSCGKVIATLHDRIISISNCFISSNINNEFKFNLSTFPLVTELLLSSFSHSDQISEQILVNIPGIEKISPSKAVKVALHCCYHNHFQIACSLISQLLTSNSWIDNNAELLNDFIQVLVYCKQIKTALTFLIGLPFSINNDLYNSLISQILHESFKSNSLFISVFCLGLLSNIDGLLSLLIYVNNDSIKSLIHYFLTKNDDRQDVTELFEFIELPTNAPRISNDFDFLPILETDPHLETITCQSLSSQITHQSKPLKTFMDTVSITFDAPSCLPVFRVDNEGRELDPLGCIKLEAEESESDDEEQEEDGSIIQVVIAKHSSDEDLDYDDFSLDAAPPTRSPAANPSSSSSKSLTTAADGYFTKALGLLEKGRFKQALLEIKAGFGNLSRDNIVHFQSYSLYFVVLTLLNVISPKSSHFLYHSCIAAIPNIEAKHRSVLCAIAAKKLEKTHLELSKCFARKALDLSVNKQANFVSDCQRIINKSNNEFNNNELINNSQADSFLQCPRCSSSLEFSVSRFGYCSDCLDYVIVCVSKLCLVLESDVAFVCRFCGSSYSTVPNKCICCAMS